jgi:hypothetical protein
MAQPIWNTTAGTLGTFSALNGIIPIQLSASPVLPATSVSYQTLSGSLPNGLVMTVTGIISGIPQSVPENTDYIFVVRATDNLGNIRDRTFSIIVSGAQAPSFTTPAGSLFSQLDSIWVEFPINYSNPISTNPVVLSLLQGRFPPGLEINENGLIRGYPAPPITNVNLPLVNTSAVATSSNAVTCFSTAGFTPNRPVIFSGTPFGGLISGVTYYVREIFPDGTSFTISTTPGGPEYTLIDDVGYMNVNLPNVSVGQPTVQTYSFTLGLESPLGSDTQSYAITITNQNAPSSIGGPNKPPNTRVPTIYNTRPPTYDIRLNDVDYSYYILPPDGNGTTYPPTEPAYIGKITSDNQFTFKIMGHDFDNNQLQYIFADLPLGLTGDSTTGWIKGNPTISDNSINMFNFSVSAAKVLDPALATPFTNFSFIIKNDIIGDVVWITPAELGTISNGTVSNEKLQAVCDIPLKYRLTPTSDPLPPNLTLLDNGEISGIVAYQPTEAFLDVDTTVEFNFTVEAYSVDYPIVSSTRTFSWIVDIQYGQPTDTLYIKCTPSISDRNLLASLLDNESLIPTDYLYRPTDPYYGRSTSVVYEHAYGIYASDFEEYVAAVTRNHYWRQITLGEIKTAVARNAAGEIIYEVVYSEVIDNLINPQGISVSKEIFWPRFIPLELGPWYTSEENIFTSYGDPSFYTSLTPGFARSLYPNSLPNMREQVGDVLGQEFNSNLLPKWMTSQQLNGSTTGFVPAWVICYTKPGFAETIKNNISNDWVDVVGNPYTLNTINFKIDRFTVDKSTTFNYDKNLVPPAWTSLPSASPTPNPLDSKNFYVLFPRQTILPDETQY